MQTAWYNDPNMETFTDTKFILLQLEQVRENNTSFDGNKIGEL